MRSPHLRPPASRVVGLLLLVLLTGCAYYNTFYLAKRSFREAERAQAKSALETTAPEAAGKYEAAIRQCTKLLTDYPKSKWVDDAMYVMGASLYGKGDYYGSLVKLDELLAKFPKSPYVAEARLIQGLARYRLRDYAAADSAFAACDRDFPDIKRKWTLYYYAGESQARQRNHVQALVWYGRAIAASSDRVERADGLRRTGDALFAAARFDSARAVYVECLRVEERGRPRLDVAFRLGESLREMRRYQEALDWFQDWKAYSLAEKREGELMLRVYECMGLIGRAREAIAGLQDLVVRFPRSPVAYEAQFRIGYLYESQLGDLDAAAREYEKLRNEPPSQFAAQAGRRVQGLASLKQYRSELVSDTTQAKPRAAFLLAELYYFQLEKTDSAEAQYRSVESQFPKSRYAPKAAYARLWILTHDRGDTLAAAALTDSIARRYPGSRTAESSLFLWKRWSGRVDERTALLDSLLAHPDSSALAERYEDEPLPERPALDPVRAFADSVRAPADSARVRPDVPSPGPADSIRALADSASARGRGAPGDSAGIAPPDTSALPAVGPLR